MTSMPASRSARAMIFAPRSCPSRPGLATTTRILRLLEASIRPRILALALDPDLHPHVGRVDVAVDDVRARLGEPLAEGAAAHVARAEVDRALARVDVVDALAAEVPGDPRPALDGDRLRAALGDEVVVADAHRPRGGERLRGEDAEH